MITGNGYRSSSRLMKARKSLMLENDMSLSSSSEITLLQNSRCALRYRCQNPCRWPYLENAPLSVFCSCIGFTDKSGGRYRCDNKGVPLEDSNVLGGGKITRQVHMGPVLAPQKLEAFPDPPHRPRQPRDRCPHPSGGGDLLVPVGGRGRCNGNQVSKGPKKTALPSGRRCSPAPR